MPVQEQTPYIKYVANGVTQTFSTEFDCESKDQLVVMLNGEEPAFTSWSYADKQVTFVTAPVVDTVVELKRQSKLNRTTDYQSFNHTLNYKALNSDFDRIWYAIQEQNYKAGQYDYDYNFVLTQVRPISTGGTGADNATSARNNLDVYSKGQVDALVATGGQANIISIGGGGTGATTIVAARASLGLDRFVQNPNLNTVMAAPSADAAIIISNTGWGIYKGNAPSFANALQINNGGTGAETVEQARVNLGLDRFAQQGASNTFMLSPNKNLIINLQNNSLSMWRNSDSAFIPIRTGFNTWVDGNGFLKNASPVLKLFADKIELNDEAQLQEIVFEKLSVGDYLIKGSSGFAQDGWYIETPKDANGNLLVAVVYEQLANGDISVKTYDYMLNNKGCIVADTETPLDIPETRWIDLRLQELPQPEIEVTDDPKQ